MSTFIPDKFSATARLLVKITNGVCTLPDGAPLPELKPGTTAELVISPWNVVDDDVRASLLKEHRVEFLPAKTSVWARVKADEIPRDLATYRAQKCAWPKNHGCFVEIRLVSPARLVVRGDGRAVLDDCACIIPALPDQDCSSINEAYTRVSVAFEPSRRSHTGNIFNCVFYEAGQTLHSLRMLRDAKLMADAPPPSA